MSVRDTILAKIRDNNLTELPLPEIPFFNDGNDDLVARYKSVLTSIGGTPRELAASETLEDLIREVYPDAERIASLVPLAGIPLTEITDETDKATLEAMDVAVLKGEFGVAENAAIWVPEANMLNRALPFISQHLVLLIEKKTLVLNMHEAYERIDTESLSYGVFIAGPSKTADIEQSLVIGAHGARSLVVVLL
nr:LUD domain-containing protein [uncultured Arsenicibacter sp.]